MKTWIAMTLLGLALTLSACDKKEAAGGDTAPAAKDDGGPQAAAAKDAASIDAAAAAEPEATDQVPTQEDFEETAAKELTKDNLEKSVKELEEELGEE